LKAGILIRGLAWAVALTIACGAGHAVAGTVVGDISVGSGKVAPADVAVWLESSHAGPVPTTKAVISQHGLTFMPQLLVIAAGQTVVMANEDDVAHNVYSRSATRPFNLGIYSKGLNKEVTFPEPGLVEIECSMHRRMKATIVVSSTPYQTMARTGARYEIAGVPAGAYELRAWSPGLGEFRARVTVPESGAAPVKVVLNPAVER
jgi:plastocyanin